MTTIDPRALPRTGRWTAARAQLAQARRRTAVTALAARRRLRSPALSLGGLACMDTAAWQVDHAFGWLAIGVSLLVYEWLGGDET